MTRKTRPTTAAPRPRPPKGPKPSAAPPATRKSPTIEPGNQGRVTLAVVTGAHGLDGAVKLKLFTDDLSQWRSFNDGALTLATLRGTVATFVEVVDRTAAEALRGAALTVARSDLPPLDQGEYYHADLIGLPARLPDGTGLGRVVAVENFGAGDVVEIERPTGKRFMAPMRPEAVPDWDADHLIVHPDFADG